MLNDKWSTILSKVEFAFQPIVSIKNGKTLAVEVFLRNFNNAGGFYSISNFFDEAFNDGMLYKVDMHLRLLVLKEFKKFDIENLRLFYNLDYRVANMPDFNDENVEELFHHLSLDKELIYFDISERSTLKDSNSLRNLSRHYKSNGFNICVDNFATGISGLQLLYNPSFDFIKLDRKFLSDIVNSTKKRLFFSSIINIAHIMNIKVIVSQVETYQEYYICKDMGADFIQGNFVQEPTSHISRVYSTYSKVKDLYKSDKRDQNINKIEKEKVTKIKSLSIDSKMVELFEYFKTNPENNFAPIVDSFNSLVGVVYEKDIKKISYSQYGMSLAKNNDVEINIKKYLKNVVSIEITWGVDKMLDIYNSNKIDQTGMFITKNNEYYGFIDLNTLLDLSYKKNLQLASDQNPLTKLPGNRQIEGYLDKAISSKETFHIVYFDFNDFKPFNDLYGFRQGDRAIFMFSDILKKYFSKEDIFIGHIGGDDFFLGFSSKAYENVYEQIFMAQHRFKNEVQSLYSKEDRENGYITTKDRFGNQREFNLLEVAAAIVELNKKVLKKDFDSVLNGVKKSSKASKTPIGISILKKEA